VIDLCEPLSRPTLTALNRVDLDFTRSQTRRGVLRPAAGRQADDSRPPSRAVGGRALVALVGRAAGPLPCGPARSAVLRNRSAPANKCAARAASPLARLRPIGGGGPRAVSALSHAPHKRVALERRAHHRIARRNDIAPPTRRRSPQKGRACSHDGTHANGGAIGPGRWAGRAGSGGAACSCFT
jgi:hypothetical protein